MNLNQKRLDISPPLKTLRTLLPYLWPKGKQALKGRVIATITLLCIAKLTNTVVPVLYKETVDSLSFGSDSLYPLYYAPLGLILAYGAARIGAQLFGELKDALFARVEQRAIRTIALLTFEHIHRLGLRFHLDRITGGLSHIIERGTSGIETLMRFMVFNILPTFLEIIFVTIVLWIFYDHRFAIVTMGTLILYIIFTLFITEWRTNFVRQMNASSTDANTKAIDSLLNYETVKYFGNEAHESRRYEAFLRFYEAAAIKTKISLSCLNMGQGLIISLGLMTVMSIAAMGVMNKTLTLGDFVLVNTYLIQLYLPLNALGFAYREIKVALINIEHMFALMNESQEIKDIPEAPPLRVTEGTIKFEDVSFNYNTNRRILKNINFTVPTGKTVAIVGRSGSGKSTLSRLLFRFYDVDSGHITIDDQDIRQVTQKSLRANLGIVPQDTVLFNDTIYYNIAYGKPDASQEEVLKAADLAQIHDFITGLPEGYETPVGERGLKLSGGEKQRVAIARTILKNPKIFIFDEATSALDTATEKAIQASLQRISRNRTTIIIAHRLSTIVDADEILVLEQGEIIERGSHAFLLSLENDYSRMWHQQLESNSTESEICKRD